MKIFVNARFLTQPLSGVQRYGIECSRQIKKLHEDVTFVAPANILHEDIAKELNVRLIGTNKGQLWEQADLPFYLAREKYPPLLNLANTAPLLYSNNYITIHDLAFHHHPEWNTKSFSTWYNILIPRLAYNCRHIFTVSQTVRGEIMQHYGVAGSKISVAYNGISQRMLNSPRVAKKEKIILSVGTFNIRKNHQKLISAYLESPLKDEYQLVIVGDKNRVFRDSGIDEAALASSNIKIYPTLSEDELIAMYQKAGIVVSLSLYEGFGIPLLEGLYNGCKVVCSDIPVYKELYDGYATFCDPQDIDSIKSALGLTAKHTNARADIDLLMNKYSYEQSARTMIGQIAFTAK